MPYITDKLGIKANSMDPDQTAPLGAVKARSTLFVIEFQQKKTADDFCVNVFYFRRRQREYDYLPRNDSLRSRSHRSSSRRPLHRKESTSSQGGTLVPLDPECNDCNEIVQEIQVHPNCVFKCTWVCNAASDWITSKIWDCLSSDILSEIVLRH